jgi:hypothetical protein
VLIMALVDEVVRDVALVLGLSFNVEREEAR